MSPLVPDEKIIFGLIASHWSNKTVHDLGKTYSHSNVDVATIAREVCTCMFVGGGGGEEGEGGEARKKSGLHSSLMHAHAQILTYTLYTLSQLSLKDDDDATPVILLPNTAHHLYGPSRPLGAVMCDYSGIRRLNLRLVV